MKKILVTGAGGYIGSIGARMFLEAGFEVVGVDNYSRGYEAPLKLLAKQYPKQFKYYSFDIRKKIDEIFKAEASIDSVVHYAAFCNVGESELHPELYFGNNVATTVALLSGMQKFGVKKILFSSTCSLYGEPQADFITEDHPVDPKSHPYSESKYMSERIIDWYYRLFGINYIFLRYFNVCGATDDGRLGDSKNPSFHLMQNAVRGALGIAEFELNNTVVDTPDQTPIRDYVNVVDLNEAHVLALKYLETITKPEVFNLGTGTGNSVLEVITAVEQILKVTIKRKVGQRRRTDVSRAVAANNKITRVLGWTPKRSLEDSVRSLAKWYQRHPQGWRR